MVNISVAKDFSPFPGGRYRRMSTHSGEEFREDVLLPALKSSTETVNVDLDGVRGYGSSFLEEVFGGIVRDQHWTTADQVRSKLKIVTRSESLRLETQQYIDEALRTQCRE